MPISSCGTIKCSAPSRSVPASRVGKTKTGEVFEQKVRLFSSNGCELVIRRITIKLLEPTRDKDLEIHVLTNLPARATACKIADAYLARWRIEAAFYKLTMVLRCELNTLGYPEAASVRILSGRGDVQRFKRGDRRALSCTS